MEQILCWYCCNQMQETFIGIPKKVKITENQIDIEAQGRFCSLEYLNLPREKHEKMTVTLQQIGRKLYGKDYVIYGRPDKILQQIFGGPMNRQQFMECNANTQIIPYISKTPFAVSYDKTYIVQTDVIPVNDKFIQVLQQQKEKINQVQIQKSKNQILQTKLQIQFI